MNTHRQNAAEFQSVFESLDDPCLVMSAELTALAANEAYLKLVGKTREQVLGGSLAQLWQELAFLGRDGAETIRASWERARAQKIADRTPALTASPEKGETRYWRCHHKPVLAPDGALRFIVQRLQDITAESRFQAEAEQLAQELESFRYSISHDLRSPLRAIDGFSQSLVEDHAAKLEPEAQAYLKRIRAASQRLDASIEALLTLSRLSRQPLRDEPVDLSALVKSIGLLLQGAHPERKVQLIVADGARTHGDAALLRIALENLLDNAWKFTRRRDPAIIEFGFKNQGPQPEYFIRDNGAGFDTGYAKKIFGVFQRFHLPTEFEGVGAGLAIAQRIIHRHRGSIRVEAELEKGATFYFKL